MSYAAYSDPYDRQTRDARKDLKSGTGSRAYVAPALKLKAGQLVARAGAAFERWSSSATGPLFYEPTRDALLKTGGDYLMTMTTVAMYQREYQSGGLPPRVGQGIGVLVLLALIGLSYVILQPVTDTPRQWNASERGIAI